MVKLKDLKEYINSLPKEFDEIDVYKLTNGTIVLVNELNMGERQGRYKQGVVTKGTYLLIK